LRRGLFFGGFTLILVLGRYFARERVPCYLLTLERRSVKAWLGGHAFDTVCGGCFRDLIDRVWLLLDWRSWRGSNGFHLELEPGGGGVFGDTVRSTYTGIVGVRGNARNNGEAELMYCGI
jgi:hypothetical protein